jgi:lipopolysaccharide transport system permease protein
MSITQRQDIIRKMYFPKMILPFSRALVIGVDSAISLAILFVFILIEQLPLTFNLLSLPLFIALNVICGMAVALWMNILNIRYRDLNQIIPSIIGICIWLTPVYYPTTIVPPQYDFIIYANPIAGIIKGFRFALLGESFPDWQYFPSIIFMLIAAALGARQFIRVEDTMVDYG